MDLQRLTDYCAGHRPGLLGGGTDCAVLVPIVDTAAGPALLFEVRSAALHRHRGEVCFPGGRMEPGETPAACALRETEEELGIPTENVTLLGPLDFLHLRSEALLYPVVGRVKPTALTLSGEVADTFTVPLDWLRTHPPRVCRYLLRPEGTEGFPYDAVGQAPDYSWTPGHMEVPVYEGLPYPLWGITGRIVQELIRRL